MPLSFPFLFMKTLRDLEVADALYLGDAGPEAVVGDQVKLFLDQEANPFFPEFILGIIQHPIVKVDCGSKTSYVIEYDEADLDGAASLIRPGDVIDYTVESVIQASIEAETAARIAADALHEADTTAHAASNIVNTPAGGVAATTVQAAINELDTEKAPKASPTFTGTVTIPSGANIVGYVPTTRTVAGRALTSDITLVSADISDASKTWLAGSLPVYGWGGITVDTDYALLDGYFAPQAIQNGKPSFGDGEFTDVGAWRSLGYNGEAWIITTYLDGTQLGYFIGEGEWPSDVVTWSPESGAIGSTVTSVTAIAQELAGQALPPAGQVFPAVPSYTDLTAANTALTSGDFWWDTTLLKLRVATA